MIAPVYEQIASQYKGKAIFTKVNVQTTNIGIDIRSMPTFQFYLKGKKQHEFSGADEGGIRRTVQMLVKKASKAKKVKEIVDFKEFKKTLRMAGKMPVVVGFVSKSSEDCKTIYPTFKSLANDYLGKALFVKVNVDDNEETAKSCKVEGPENTPTFQFYKRGKMEEEVAGADERTLTDACTSVIGEVGEDESESGSDDGDGGDKKPKKKKRRLPKARKASRTTTEKVIILGAGPAGLSAAIYAARAGLNPIVLAPKVGGQLMSTKEVENYPGMIESEGTWIVEAMREQAQLYGTGYEEDWATSVDLSVYPFELKTNSSTFTTRTLIIATGADSRWLNIPGEEKYKTQGVSSCATCDGFLYKNRNVVVIGGGDTAMEDSLVLARICKSVKLLHRRDSFRASKILQDRVMSHKKIEIMWNTVAEEFTGTDKLTGVKIKNTKTGEQSELTIDGGFVAIGHDPNTNLFKGQLSMGDDGYLDTFNHSTYTSIPGVFAAGDVADHVYRQAVTSAGTGSMSALDAERWISANGWDKAEVPNVPLLPEDFPKWRVKKLKEAMAERLLSSKGCVEKKDFVKKLQKWQKKKRKSLAQEAASVEVDAAGGQSTGDANYDEMSLDQIHVAMQGKGLGTDCTAKVDCIASLKAAM